MSTLMAPPPTDPKELRPLVQRKLEAATNDDIAAVHRFLLGLEARRLADELGSEMQADWDAGRITKESIAEAILEHRRQRPYR